MSGGSSPNSWGPTTCRTLGTAAVVDPAADPVVVSDDFFERLCVAGAGAKVATTSICFGAFCTRAKLHASPHKRLPVTITLCDATDKREAADLYAMFFQSDRWERHLREVLTVPVGYQAISERTRLDALSMGVPQEAIQTVHLWVDPKLGELRERARGGGHEDYVAFVGGLAEYKGTGHLLDFALAYPDYPIRITGYTASDFPIEWARYPSIQYLGYLPYRDAMRLVARARALLYLSYSEGFGLPMIEAQALGVPLIVNPRNVMVRELLAKGSYVSAGDVGSPTSIKVAIDVATRTALCSWPPGLPTRPASTKRRRSKSCFSISIGRPTGCGATGGSGERRVQQHGKA